MTTLYIVFRSDATADSDIETDEVVGVFSTPELACVVAWYRMAVAIKSVLK